MARRFVTVGDDGALPGSISVPNVVVVVDAGADLDTARPASAASVLWRFDAGVDVGTGGANVTNGEVGDLYFVADA